MASSAMVSPVMASPALAIPPWKGYQSIYRFSVAQYQRMIEVGILEEDDAVELLEGYVVLKMPRNPPHDGTIQLVEESVKACLPPGWVVRTQSAITLTDSEPEPDVAVVRGDRRSYLAHHPRPADIGMLVEVADSSLDSDREEKARIYARAGITSYWIVNLVDHQVEVFSGPSGPTATPAYTQRQILVPGGAVPLILDGVQIASMPVSELLP